MFPSVLSLHDDIGRMSTSFVEKFLCIPWTRKTMCKSRVQDVLISKNLGVRSEQEQLLQGGHTKVQRCRAEDFSSFQVFKLITEQRKEKISPLEKMCSMYVLFLQSRWRDKNFEARISGFEDIYRAAL